MSWAFPGKLHVPRSAYHMISPMKSQWTNVDQVPWSQMTQPGALTQCYLKTRLWSDRPEWNQLQWRHNEPDSDSNHRRLDSLLNRLFTRRSKKTSKLLVTGLWNSPVAGGFPSQRASYADNVSIWWRHRVNDLTHCGLVSKLYTIGNVDMPQSNKMCQMNIF